jgi:hypothetical protein
MSDIENSRKNPTASRHRKIDAMPRAWRRAVIAACLLLAGGAGVWSCDRSGSRARRAEAGVWFEPLRFRSVDLDGFITATDLKTVESVARAEIVRAFAGLPIEITDRRDAPYRVRVVESVRDPRFRSHVEVAGASWGVTGRRGHGAVSFHFLASGALAHAPADADRVAKIEAIGRGIGRTVVHELVHQFFPSEPVHSADAGSYEFESASRRVQYYGEMHWSVARPLLLARFGAEPKTMPEP